jgi:putative ABC transport system permease protein
MALLVGAVAISLLGVGSTLGAFSIMSREMNRAYLATHPASATLDTSAVGEDVLQAVRALPGVKDAQARATVQGRVRVGQDWRPAVLFVVPDFNGMRMGSFERVTGEWPPPTGTFLVEHMALSVLEAGVGDTVSIKPPHGAPVDMRVAGVAYDAGLAPATMERTVYGYLTPETLAWMGETGGLDELKITVTGDALDSAGIETVARRVAAFLEGRGMPVHAIAIPPPGRHPHQGQMNAVMLMLNIFSVVSLLLSGILVANTMAAIMARQVKEIGVMKAVGARSAQVVSQYVWMVSLLGVAAVLTSVGPAMMAARALSQVAAHGLNIELQSEAIAWWAYAFQAGAGILVPVVAALVPVVRAARMSVHQALADTASNDAMQSGGGWLTRWLPQTGLVSLALKNALRKKARLAMTLSLLAAGGAMFLTGVNTRSAWTVRLSEVGTARKYDVEVRLEKDASRAEALKQLQAVPGVVTSEAWGLATAAPGTQQGPELNHEYPDRGHGAFRILGTPLDTTLVDFPLVAGRWLQPGDTNAVVLNHVSAPLFPGVQPGQDVTLSVEGEPHTLRVVGVVRDIGSPASAYVPLATFDRFTGARDSTRMLRVSSSSDSAAMRADVIRRVDLALAAAGMTVSQTIPMAELKTAVGEHMAVLLGVILGLAALMTLVGALGLAAAMGISVLERTRELGVMQAVGATQAMVLKVVMGEGLGVGLMSSILAVMLAAPLSLGVGTLIGTLAFRAPLPLVMSPAAVAVWLLLVVALAGLATAVPSLRASRMTVREALAST